MARRAMHACALAFGAWLACASPALAAPTVVSVCGRDDATGGTNLSAALAQGGDIQIRCGAGAATIRITRTHPLGRATRIDGAGTTTLIGSGQAPMFTTAHALDLTGLSITHDPQGAPMLRRPSVVESTASLRLVRVRTERTTSPYQARRFTATDSDFNGNGPADDRSFGVVINARVIELVRSRFRGNREHLTGGGPIDQASQPPRRMLIVRESEFIDNRRALLALDGTKVEIVSSRFRQNGAAPGPAWDCCGGALTAAHADITITGSEFTANRSGGAGGAILAIGSSLRIADTLFTGNEARAGGAISSFATPMAAGTWNMGAPLPDALGLRLERVRFRDNISDSIGGAIVWTGGLTGRGALFAGNRATAAGGAIAHPASASAADPASDAALALASIVSLTQPATDRLTLGNGIFLDNRAPQGAAIDGGTAFVALGNGLVARNQATGSGAAVRSEALRLVNTTVTENIGLGALLSSASGSLVLSNAIIANNTRAACQAPIARIVAQGANLQFPGGTCGAAVPSLDPGLNAGFKPGLGSPARAGGAIDPCMTDPLVLGLDLHGNARGARGACAIGAIEDIHFADEARRALSTDDGERNLWFWLLLLLLLLVFLCALRWGWKRARRKRAED